MPAPEYLVKLSALEVGADDTLPGEFLIFAAGDNESLKGTARFTPRSAELVMEEYAKHGVDIAMDLEHSALSEETVVARADATDAMCWFGLGVRSGSLWAVDVKWTPEGSRRLRMKTQRYTSPAFYLDSESGEVLGLVNVALCSRPATLQNAPLVAATAMRINTDEVTDMDPNQLKAVIAALKEENGEAALKLLEEMLAAAAGAEEAAPAAEGEALAETPEPEPPKPDEEEMAMAAALRTCTGRTSAGEAIAALSAMRKRCDDLDAERAKFEASQRRELVGDLVKCGAEIPATAWKGDAADRVPTARLQREPIVELRARVAAMQKANPSAPAQRQLTAPTTGADDAADLAAAAQIKDPDKRAGFLATRRARAERAGK